MSTFKIALYNKLVRDRIPEYIEDKGKKPLWQILESQEEYLRCLHEKLQEEVAEYLEDHSLEELADVLEVVYACAALQQVTPDKLELIRKKKYAARGGFAKRIYLESVVEK